MAYNNQLKILQDASGLGLRVWVLGHIGAGQLGGRIAIGSGARAEKTAKGY